MERDEDALPVGGVSGDHGFTGGHSSMSGVIGVDFHTRLRQREHNPHVISIRVFHSMQVRD